jgi:class 3 adenylate cyclase
MMAAKVVPSTDAQSPRVSRDQDLSSCSNEQDHSPQLSSQGRGASPQQSAPNVTEQSTAQLTLNPVAQIKTTSTSGSNGADIFGKQRLCGTSAFEPGFSKENSLKRVLSNVTETVTENRSRVARLCYSFVALNSFQTFMIALTVAILYIGDLYDSLGTADSVSTLTPLLFFCLFVFSAEWALNVISSPVQVPVYNGSLFFYLDFVATCSIGIDILLNEANNLAQNGPIARAARAARIGTRAGRSIRLMRILRFIRIVRITRVLKAVMSFREGRRARGRSNSDHKVLQLGTSTSSEELSSTRADSIGAQMGATTTKKAVLLVLVLLISVPLLERDLKFHLCNAEFAAALEGIHASPRVGRDCDRFREEVSKWFRPGSRFLEHSRAKDSGLTRNGILYAIVENCEIFRDEDLLGQPHEDPNWNRLYDKRRGTEITVVPCEVSGAAVSWGEGGQTATYFLYDFRQEYVDDANFSMGLTTAIVAILLFFSYIFASDAETISNQLVLPMRQLMKDMFYTAKLQLDEVGEHRVPSDVFEMKTLQLAFLNLYGAVASFSKFTPLEVVRHFLSLGTEAQLGVSRRNISIFFSDIAGFTTICEGTAPVDVLALLSEYFENMVSIIVDQKGTMLEFIGDAILAIWNAPTDVSDHAVRAVTSAVQMNMALDSLRDDWVRQGKPNIRIRIGLHSADVYVGNLGSKMRMKYGVLGDGVNLASRLEELNKRYATDILVTEDVLEHEGVKELFLTRPVDFVIVKGRTAPTRVYEVLGFRSNASDVHEKTADLAARAFQSYLDRDFSKAISIYEQVTVIRGRADLASEVIAERCKRFLQDPPPADWDGVDILKEKTF